MVILLDLIQYSLTINHINDIIAHMATNSFQKCLSVRFWSIYMTFYSATAFRTRVFLTVNIHTQPLIGKHERKPVTFSGRFTLTYFRPACKLSSISGILRERPNADVKYVLIMSTCSLFARAIIFPAQICETVSSEFAQETRSIRCRMTTNLHELVRKCVVSGYYGVTTWSVLGWKKNEVKI